MTSDRSLKDIFDELEYEPSIYVANVDVSVKDGIVTRTGNVSSFAQRRSLRFAVRFLRPQSSISRCEVLLSGKFFRIPN